MNTFYTSNKWQYRLLRTIVQAICGFFVNNIAMIIAQTNFNATIQAMIVAVVMAVLSPIMANLGAKELPDDFFEGNKSEDE